MVRFKVLVVLLVLCALQTQAQTQYSLKSVFKGLTIPWEIEFGADGALWCTERPGVFSRINLTDDTKQVVLDLRGKVYAAIEVGMLGFALDPSYPDSPYVYVCYTAGNKDHFYRIVERYTFDGDLAYNPVEIFRHDPAANFHQGCRLLAMPDRTMFITNGDGPFVDDPMSDSVVQTKILRINLDGTPAEGNPVPGSRMWSKGHRNVQGLTLTQNGKLWSSEHGNAIDDEINLVEPGSNYGWPYVEGYCDQDYEKVYCDSAGVTEPRWSSGNSTVAMCGLAYYNNKRYPDLSNSLLLATLKGSSLIALKLNDSCTEVTDVQRFFMHSVGRIRDVAVHPDGRIFICTSNREANAYMPFPREEDDQIYEVSPLSDTLVGVPVVADSMHVKAWVNDELSFEILIRNDGDGILILDNSYVTNGNSPIVNRHWRFPIYVMPRSSYSLQAGFAPTEEGSFENSMHIGVVGYGYKVVKLTGSTDIGLLEPDSTSVITSCYNHDSADVVIPFRNIGFDTLLISDAYLTGKGAQYFSIVESPKGVLSPGEHFDYLVRFLPTVAGIHQCTLYVKTHTYRDSYSVITGLAVVSSVNETSLPINLVIAPNPFSSSVTFSFNADASVDELLVLNTLGQVVYRQVVYGENSVTWNPTTPHGTAGSAAYRVVLITKTETISAPFIRLGQ